MTFFLIVGLVCVAFAAVCAWADSQPPADPDPYDQPTHVGVLADQEHNA